MSSEQARHVARKDAPSSSCPSSWVSHVGTCTWQRMQHPCQSPIATPTLSSCASDAQGLTTSVLRHQSGQLWLPREIEGLTQGQTPLDAPHLWDLGAQSLWDIPLGAAGAARQRSGRHRPRHPTGPPYIQSLSLTLSQCMGLPRPESSRASLYIDPVLGRSPWNSIIQRTTHAARGFPCMLTYLSSHCLAKVCRETASGLTQAQRSQGVFSWQPLSRRCCASCIAGTAGPPGCLSAMRRCPAA